MTPALATLAPEFVPRDADPAVGYPQCRSRLLVEEGRWTHCRYVADHQGPHRNNPGDLRTWDNLRDIPS